MEEAELANRRFANREAAAAGMSGCNSTVDGSTSTRMTVRFEMATVGVEQESAIIKNLAEAVSTQARVANRIWLATMTVAFIVMVPRQITQDDIKLPFDLGQVPGSTFLPVAFGMLTILVVSLAAAHAQQIRAHRLAQRVISRLEQANSSSARLMHPRDLFDLLREPSITRVAPLAQWTQGCHQFAEDMGTTSSILRVASTVYYVVLKIMTLTVLFLLPGVALVIAYQRIEGMFMSGGPLLACQAAGLIALISLGVVAFADSEYVFDVVLLLFRGRPPREASQTPPVAHSLGTGPAASAAALRADTDAAVSPTHSEEAQSG